MAKHSYKYLLICLVISEFLVVDIWGQNEAASLSGDTINSHNDNTNKEVEVNYELRRPHHIVKRKSKGRGFGFGKSKSKSKPQPNRDPYPKQPPNNPNYPGAGAPPAYPGAPPAYPGSAGNRPSYPAGPPPPYPGTGGHNPSYPAGPPPAYPGMSHNNYPGYGQPSYPGYGSPGYGAPGYGQGGFGGKGFGSRGGGLGSSLGAAGFGAVAGTALGAYGGYQLGRMVGGMGRSGHYGYYDDNGRHVKCDPPTNIKVDPETNRSYIPLEDDYDKRCRYFDRRPPPYYSGYTNGAGSTTSHPINRLINDIISLTIAGNYHLVWENILPLTIFAILLM